MQCISISIFCKNTHGLKVITYIMHYELYLAFIAFVFTDALHPTLKIWYPGHYRNNTCGVMYMENDLLSWTSMNQLILFVENWWCLHGRVDSDIRKDYRKTYQFTNSWRHTWAIRIFYRNQASTLYIIVFHRSVHVVFISFHPVLIDEVDINRGYMYTVLFDSGCLCGTWSLWWHKVVSESQK